jgi:hypothetical protein
LLSHLRLGLHMVSSLQVCRLKTVCISHLSNACYMPHPSLIFGEQYYILHTGWMFNAFEFMLCSPANNLLKFLGEYYKRTSCFPLWSVLGYRVTCRVWVNEVNRVHQSRHFVSRPEYSLRLFAYFAQWSLPAEDGWIPIHERREETAEAPVISVLKISTVCVPNPNLPQNIHYLNWCFQRRNTIDSSRQVMSQEVYNDRSIGHSANIAISLYW